MYRITHVRVEGFWGRSVAEAHFHPDVNVIIGPNGSGKTTFMDLLQGAIRADLRILGAHDFSTITIKLQEENRHRTIKVTKQRDEDTLLETVRFQVGTSAFHLPLYPPEIDASRHFRNRHRQSHKYDELRQKIAALVSISSLSVHRTAFEPVGDDDYVARRRSQRPPLDVRLEDLLQKLTVYQLELAQRAAEVSAQFQKDVLASILFDQRYDTFSLKSITATDLSQHQEQLSQAYKELGVLTKSVAASIAKHVEAIKKSVAAVVANNATEGEKRFFQVNDVLPLPLLRRSQHIVDLLSEAEGRKREVSLPIRDYIKTLRSFVKDKKIEVSPNGEFIVERESRRIAVPQLSSGEKQLFILLTETLLQRRVPFVFLADEPELSLHIEWQAEVIGSIRRLNENAQIIVATHSPEIAAGWSARIIDMAGVVYA